MIRSKDDLIEEFTKNPNKEIKVNLTYPNSDEYDFFTEIQTIDLDTEMKEDIKEGRGFLISSPKATTKKDIKNPDGIYSTRFGQKLGDANPFADRYSCECGNLKSRINHGIECPICRTKCKFVDDDFKYFGWTVLKDQYHIIHPKFYDTLDYIFGASPYNTERKKIKGSKLQNMLNYSPEVDQHGHPSECIFKPDNEPFYGIGMLEFYDRFDEILDYYKSKFPKKQDYFNEIEDHKYACECRRMMYKKNVGKICPICNKPVQFIDKAIIFTHSVPVFTTHLRPTDITADGKMYFEPTNAIYNMINKHIHSINNDKRKLNRDIKVKNSELFKVQTKFMELTDEIFEILQGKKGQLRQLLSGRYTFSSRAVIRQSGALRIDQVLLPYTMLVKCLQQRIINVLMRTYNISPSEAYDIWSRAVATKDDRIAEIINAIIKSYPEGLPVIINRNPTINYGSILMMNCIGFTDTLTMSVPLQVLAKLAADFDGDVLNIFIIINKAFEERARAVFNPRNAMYISRIDGKLDSSVLVQRDTLINANTLLHLGRHIYSDEDMSKIKLIQEKQAEYFSV